MKLLNFILSIALVAGFSAQAQSKRTTKKATPAPAAEPTHNSGGMDGNAHNDGVPWGMAGCSVWNYAIKSKEQGPQLGVYMLEHFVFGVQTFAISSGTLNCVDSKTRRAAVDQEVFVTVNLASLQKEAAQGRGDHLDTLAEIFGCKDKEGFAHMSQNRYEAIFADEQPNTVLQNYKSEIKSVNASCSRAG